MLFVITRGLLTEKSAKMNFEQSQDAANEKKVIRDDIITSKMAYEKQYQVFRKLLKASYKEIALSEIMDCIDEIIICPNKNITVKWAIEFLNNIK
ncbi:MAG: hypothetical protein ACLU9S_02950 [Oscillospiraceae bacterium]